MSLINGIHFEELKIRNRIINKIRDREEIEDGNARQVTSLTYLSYK